MNMQGMSTGQGIGAVIGGVIGGIVGSYIPYVGTYTGFMVGSAIGGGIGRLIDPPDAPKAPPAGDVTINSFTRNAPVPVLFGQDKASGGVIMMGGISTDMRNAGSSKSPEYEIKMDVYWGVAHCEGPVVEVNPPRHWVNDKYTPWSGSGNSYYGFTTYLGGADQDIDPYFESFFSTSLFPLNQLPYTCWSSIRAHVEGSTLSALPSIALELRGFCVEEGELDANPIRVAWDWMTNLRYGMGIGVDEFNGDPDTEGSPWKTAADFCDVLAEYIDHNGDTQQEPRFRYSRYINAKNKGFDILSDIFISCRGILRSKQGKIEPLIHTGSEPIEHYYSDRLQVEFTIGSSTANRINANFSAYPDDFWNASSGTILLANGSIVEFFVLDQTSSYIDLCFDITEDISEVTTFKLLKDNIKESSFTYNMLPENTIPRIYRVEFINRQMWDAEINDWANEYQSDSIEIESPVNYITQVSYGDIQRTIKTVRSEGIKRKSQAMRIGTFLCDNTRYARNMCSFTTGLEGYIHAVGDTIGVSHAQTGWNKKAFHILNMEETENDEINLVCIEFNPALYTDPIVNVYESIYSSANSPWNPPLQVELFYAVQDVAGATGRVYMLFKRPPTDSFWFGVQIFVQRGAGADFDYADILTITTPSVKLASDITDIVTTIPFDNSTLYGAFPTAGGFWVENEYITYTGISGTSFTGCTRNVLYRVAHTAAKYCYLKQTDTPYISYDPSDVGNQWTFKAVSYNMSGVTADYEDAPTMMVTLV